MTIAVKDALDATAAAVGNDPSIAAVSIAATGELIGATEVDIRLDGRTVKIDQPEALGGGGLAPNPVQFALASLAACQAHTYRFWSEKLGIRIDALRVDVDGGLDVRGIFGLADGVRAGFGNVEVRVEIDGPERPERYAQLREAVDEHCPMLDVFANEVPVRTSLRSS